MNDWIVLGTVVVGVLAVLVAAHLAICALVFRCGGHRWLPRWLRRYICWYWGHNLVGVELPVGWSLQTCRTCGERISGHRRQPKEPS